MSVRSLLKNCLRRALQRFSPTMRTLHYGRTLYYDAGTDIGWQLMVHGAFERSELEICARFLRSDSVVVDIGANIGLHTVAFSSIARDGLVIAIEPSPRVFPWLLRNTSGIQNVVRLHVALGNSCGITDFFVASDNAYSGLRDTGRKALVEKIRVPCYQGDQVLPSLLNSKLDLVKIDVEGLETEVLSGMRMILATARPIVFCEIFGGAASNPDPEHTIRMICKLGYRAYTVDGSTLRSYTMHDDRVYNYLFVPVEKVDTFPILSVA